MDWSWWWSLKKKLLVCEWRWGKENWYLNKLEFCVGIFGQSRDNEKTFLSSRSTMMNAKLIQNNSDPDEKFSALGV
jgi:hypothetical protein